MWERVSGASLAGAPHRRETERILGALDPFPDDACNEAPEQEHSTCRVEAAWHPSDNSSKSAPARSARRAARAEGLTTSLICRQLRAWSGF